MRRVSFILSLICFCLFLASAPIAAQEGIILSLQAAETNLQTGQEYQVEIYLEGAVDMWAADLEIGFDPATIYVMGTKSGSPVSQGEFFTPSGSLTVRNAVQENLVLYTLSLFGDATPADGAGVIGRFRIYPLAPGATTLLFSKAELRNVVGASDIGEVEFLPVLLELNVTGTPVEPPSEATATPRPTDTPEPTQAIIGEVATEEPTLVNVTLAPRTPTPLPDAPDGGQSSLLPLAIGLVVVSGLGLLALGLYWSRSRKR